MVYERPYCWINICVCNAKFGISILIKFIEYPNGCLKTKLNRIESTEIG